MPGLAEWVSYDVLPDLRVILEAEGRSSPARRELVARARQLILATVPSWVPGRRLTPAEAALVGRELESCVNEAKYQLGRRSA